jgi:DNA-binding SARP family transcriptional activator
VDNALLREDGYRRTRSTPVAGAGFIRIGLGDGLCHVGAKAIVMPARELEVCATIGLNGRPIATEAILDLVWPDSETARARTCLKVHVHRIRARLGRRSALFCSGERWSLGPDVTLDLWEWERTANQAGRVPSTEPQRNALFATFDALLAGPAPSLARSHLGCRLDMAFLELLQLVGSALIDDAFARRDLAGAARLARSAIAVDPYRERWHEALIRAQVDQGDLFAARSSLRSYQATLQAELGEPLPKAIESLLSKGASAV